MSSDVSKNENYLFQCLSKQTAEAVKRTNCSVVSMVLFAELPFREHFNIAGMYVIQHRDYL